LEDDEVAGLPVSCQPNVELVVLGLQRRIELPHHAHEMIHHLQSCFAPLLFPVSAVSHSLNFLVLINWPKSYSVEDCCEDKGDSVGEFDGIELNRHQGDVSVEEADHIQESARDVFRDEDG